MITEKTLKKWRADALDTVETIDTDRAKQVQRKLDPLELIAYASAQRILRLTQVLLDQQLLQKSRMER